MKKTVSLLLALVTLCSVSTAFAGTLEPTDTEIERLAGETVHATVGDYDKETKTFNVAVYDYDRYAKEDVRNLVVGDTILAGGWLHKITGIEDVNETVYYICEDGEEICFGKSYDSGDDHDKLIARSSMDDRIFMNAVAVLHLPLAEGIVYVDDSDPDLESVPVVTEGLDSILKAQAEKIETSIGFDFYATTITLNEDLEIVKIHQGYDVAQ